MIASGQTSATRVIEQHLNNVLAELSKKPDENRYVISWILYFLKSNRLRVKRSASFVDPILKSIQSNKCKVFEGANGFRLFRGVRAARHSGGLLKHLDVFKQQ